MFAYGPKVYEGGGGNSGFILDMDNQAASLLNQKLAVQHSGAGAHRANSSRGTSPASSTVPHSAAYSPARSCSMTPDHGMSLVRSHSNLLSSRSSQSSSLVTFNQENPGNWSTSHENNESDDHGATESSNDDHHSNTPTISVCSDIGSQKSDSEADGFTLPASHHSDSDMEIITVQKTPQKKKSTSSKDVADDTP